MNKNDIRLLTCNNLYLPIVSFSDHRPCVKKISLRVLSSNSKFNAKKSNGKSGKQHGIKWKLPKNLGQKNIYMKLYASTIMRHNKFGNIARVSRDYAHAKFFARGLHSINSNIVSGELQLWYSQEPFPWHQKAFESWRYSLEEILIMNY